jgi:hypothetical protein
MSYVIYNSKQAGIDREKQLTEAGVKAGYFPVGERYDFGGLLILHPTQDRSAIEIYKSPGILTPLSQPDIMPCNYEPIFTEDERASAVNELTSDWFQTLQAL